MRRAWLGLGSNLGDRMEQLRQAAGLIAAAEGIASVRPSPVYETDPVGLTQQPRFLNAVLEVETDLEARGLLELAMSVEAALGRVREERWGPRTIDVDILVLEDTEIDEPDLTVPHPRLIERAFVLEPLADLAPRLRLPGLGATPSGLLARLDAPAVRRWPEALEISGGTAATP